MVLGLDMIGLGLRSIEEYADMTVDLIEAGYAEQIILSHDSTAVSRGLAETFRDDYPPSADPNTIIVELLPVTAAGR